MRAFRILTAIVPVLMLAIVTGCATPPTKASKSAYLVGEGDGKTTEKQMLSDLARNVQLKTKREWTDVEKKQMQNTKEFAESKTDTTIQIYPYTKPLLKARITKNVQETAFKENWPTEKIQPEIDKSYAMEVKRLITDRQCFGAEIDSNDPEATRLDYWYGTVDQDGKTQKLKFTKGSGYSQKGLWVDRSAMPKVTKVYQYADACTEGKLNLLGDIKVLLEPRFRHEILPINLTWLAPADAATVATTTTTPAAPAPAKKK
ncbi:MAG: hypothetical protein V4760_11320 [Bdellovibrionota bacterium]